ncbi:MAG: restriction endonuclease [Patescibacteria group bacterium]
MQIIKATGETEQFNKGKFCKSLERAGAPKEVVGEVCSLVAEELKPGMTTNDIFRQASKYLARKNISAAARYNTKRGIANLGPAGFVFEQFVEIVLHELGYKTARNKFVKGMCVSHEVDVLAWKGGEHVIVEAKYHNQPNTKTHIDQVMYADARLMDIERAHEKNGERGVRHTIWVFTNTKFTEKAIRYAKCRNMRLTGWGYPAKENLEILVDRFLLHPVTVLPSVDRFSLERLSQAGVMLARDIAPYTPEKFARAVNIDLPRAQKIVREAHALVYGK